MHITCALVSKTRGATRAFVTSTSSMVHQLHAHDDKQATHYLCGTGNDNTQRCNATDSTIRRRSDHAASVRDDDGNVDSASRPTVVGAHGGTACNERERLDATLVAMGSACSGSSCMHASVAMVVGAEFSAWGCWHRMGVRRCNLARPMASAASTRRSHLGGCGAVSCWCVEPPPAVPGTTPATALELGNIGTGKLPR